MAAILLSACTVTMDAPLNGYNVWKIVTPATADDGDTIDVSSIINPLTVVSARAQGATDGSVAAVVTTAGLFTLPGAADNEARTCYIVARNA